MSIEKEIMACIENNGMYKPSIVLNGAYLTHSGRRVYVEPVPFGVTKCLRFFVRTYNKVSKDSEEQEIPSIESTIRSVIESDSLFGVSISVCQSGNRSKIFANADYNILFIESELYGIAYKMQEANSANFTFMLGGQQVSLKEARAIRQVFLMQSLESYRDMVYAVGTNRFIKGILRANRFYGISPMSFVPIFITFKSLYNPLENSNLGVKDTKMYKMAVGKGRFVEKGNVSAYFLTHKEICEAFGMTRFVRFTPYIWYSIFVGLLQQSNAAFPNKVSQVIHWMPEQQPPEGMKRNYMPDEFTRLLMNSEKLPEEELAQFQKVDSLEAFIEKEHNLLKSIGPYYLDNRKNLSVEKLYELYAEAKLLY